MGRLPKRSMLATTPPPPHLTGNLFVIDLAAVDHGWAMLPAQAIHATEAGVAPVPARKWAGMTELSPGVQRSERVACNAAPSEALRILDEPVP